MQETRQNKIARLLQKELSLIFQEQTRSLHGVMISVTRAKISPDLSICTAYLSIFPSERGEELTESIVYPEGAILEIVVKMLTPHAVYRQHQQGRKDYSSHLIFFILQIYANPCYPPNFSVKKRVGCWAPYYINMGSIHYLHVFHTLSTSVP